MYLIKNSADTNSTMIRGVRYITVSHYGGEKDIVQKLGDMILEDYQLCNVTNPPNESLSNLDMDSDVA